jgi:beta-N-acetylhexosaminidase
MIVARFRGPTPSAAFLSRIRTGQIGGVILFGDNVAGGVDATRRLTTLLQSAAKEGGHPPLLVMADQEGGPVKRLPGPPALAAADMTSPALATAQGTATGRLLRSAGVNLDLAPVADVERSPNFLGTRSFGSSPGLVGARACAFAQGLASQGVAYTLKHFPGLGLATGNTDLGSVAVSAPAATLRAGYRAYRLCGHGPLALVMISSARYPGLAASLPAVMSPAIYRRELPLAIRGSLPVTISDDLQSPAIESQDAPARHAIDAGLDLLLYAQTEQASADAYGKLLDELSSGVISPDHLRVANRLIEALKSHLGH